MVSPTDHVKNPVRDPPPHLTGTSIFNIPKIELSKKLIPISNPIYKDELLENVHTAHYQTDMILGSFASCHVNQMAAKAQIIKALKLGYIYLWHTKLKLSAELTRMILRKPRVHEVILFLENLFERFRVVHDFEEINALAPDPDVLTSLRKKLSQLREEAKDYLVGNGMAMPRMLLDL